MEHAERMMSYLCAQLEVVQANVPRLIALLTALVELFDKDVDHFLRIAAANLRLHVFLVDILNQSWPHRLEFRDKDRESECQLRLQKTVIDSVVWMHPLTHTLVLKCLHYLSTLHRIYYFKFVDRHLIETVVRYLRPPRLPIQCSTSGAHCDERLKEALQGLLETCQGKVKVRLYSNQDQVSEWTKLLLFYEPDYFWNGCTCEQLKDVHMCTLKVKVLDTFVDIDHTFVDIDHTFVDIDHALVDIDHALESNKCSHLSTNEKRSAESQDEKVEVQDWLNACVTQVLRGTFLWLQLGDKCMRAADCLARSLQSSCGHLAKTTAVRNDLVAAHISGRSQEKLIRARVTQVTGQTFTVFDIDTGNVHKLQASDLFCLPAHLDQAHIAPMATLVCLQGTSSLHVDERAVEIAAATLAQICRFSIRDRAAVKEEIMDSRLPDLLVCPDVNVVRQGLSLATNLLLGDTKWGFWWQCIMTAVVETLKCCALRALKEAMTASENRMEINGSWPAREENPASTEQQVKRLEVGQNYSECARSAGEVSKATNQELIRSCLMLLANQLCVSREARDFLSQSQGLSAVIRAYLLHVKDKQIRMATTRIVHSLVCKNPASPEFA